MNIRWKQLLIRAAVWGVAELLLTLMGLDDLADYNEYVFQNHSLTQQSMTQIANTFPNLGPRPLLI
jgi:hypothetical protein